jgi:hypothetical protein
MLGFYPISGAPISGLEDEEPPPVPPIPEVDDIELIGAQSRKARLRIQREQEERAALARRIVITSIAQIIASGVLDE